jgi:hypothetical protein
MIIQIFIKYIIICIINKNTLLFKIYYYSKYIINKNILLFKIYYYSKYIITQNIHKIYY